MYSYEVVEAIAKWQNGWRECQRLRKELADNLMIVADQIPDKARLHPGRCYRILYLDKRSLGKLVFESELGETVGSWTTNREFAEKFKGAYREGHIGFIFGHIPSQDEIVVDISAMRADEDFDNSLKRMKAKGMSFHPALEHFKDSLDQNEVVLNVSKLAMEEVVGLSGAGDFEELCLMAGIEPEEKDEFWKYLIENEIYPDDKVWLSEEATRRVLKLAQPHFDEIENPR